MLFVKKKKRTKLKLEIIDNKGIIVNLRIYKNRGLSVY